MNQSLRSQSKPNTTPVVQRGIGGNGRGVGMEGEGDRGSRHLLEEYEMFHYEMLSPKRESIFKGEVVGEGRGRLSTDPDRELKPVFISLSTIARGREKKQVRGSNVQSSYFTCCGSLENVDVESEAQVNLGKKRYYYQNK